VGRSSGTTTEAVRPAPLPRVARRGPNHDGRLARRPSNALASPPCPAHRPPTRRGGGCWCSRSVANPPASSTPNAGSLSWGAAALVGQRGGVHATHRRRRIAAVAAPGHRVGVGARPVFDPLGAKVCTKRRAVPAGSCPVVMQWRVGRGGRVPRGRIRIAGLGWHQRAASLRAFAGLVPSGERGRLVDALRAGPRRRGATHRGRRAGWPEAPCARAADAARAPHRPTALRGWRLPTAPSASPSSRFSGVD